MKKGIIRIVSGSIMMLLQILATVIQTNTENNFNITNVYDVTYSIGYYSTGIIGLILLIFGCKAYNKGLRSEVILHPKTSKLNTVIKCISISICFLVVLSYIVSMIQQEDYFNIFSILIICSTVLLIVYLLFYLYKRPSCLFSASLIFMGIAYIYGIFSNITYYILNLPEIDNYELYIFFGLIPRIASGIIYIIIATMIYKEHFSVNCIKILGLAVLVLELSDRILCNTLIFGSLYYSFYNIADILSLLLVVMIFFFISIFKLDTIKRQEVFTEDNTPVRFCRKCGEALLSGSGYCSKCGTEIICIGEENDEM